MDQSPTNPSKRTMVLVAVGLVITGLFLFLNGLGLVNADWLRPNPLTPHWVLSIIGALIFLSGILAAGKVVPLPVRSVNVIGYSVIALAMIVAHWLVFFSVGGSCELVAGEIFFVLNILICRGLAGVILAVFDLVFVVLAITSIWRNRKP